MVKIILAGSEIASHNLSHLLEKTFGDKRFFCIDGTIIDSLENLGNAIKKMSSETFAYHVNARKNDFSSWIYDCIGDVDLAEEIRNAKTKKRAVQKINSRVESIKKKLSSKG